MICSNKDCQAVYSLISLAPRREKICDYCGSPLISRDDDKEEVIKKRLKQYPSLRDELLSFYESSGQKVEILNIEDKKPCEVFEGFKELL